MANPSLNELPIEIVENIVLLLDLPDIRNLRLVSRNVAANSSQGLFRSHFIEKKVKWTSIEEMEQFVQLTQVGWMGCLLQRLILIGTPVTDEEYPSERLLSEAFANLQQFSAQKGLESLILLVTDGNDWKQVWKAAGNTFNVTLRALSSAALMVRELDIFDSASQCSLSCNYITPALESSDLTKSFEKLRHLSLSISSHVRIHDKDEASESAEAGIRDARSIFQLLELCPQLETLKLHWYRVKPSNDMSEAQLAEQRFLTHVTQLEQLSQLRNLQLAGIYTDGATLLALAKKLLQLQNFEMTEIHLEDGTFAPTFDYLTDQMASLERLELEGLWESRLIHFKKPQRTNKTPHLGPIDLMRTGADCRRRIRYYLPTSRTKASAAGNRWFSRRYTAYGPPGFCCCMGPCTHRRQAL